MQLLRDGWASGCGSKKERGWRCASRQRGIHRATQRVRRSCTAGTARPSREQQQREVCAPTARGDHIGEALGAAVVRRRRQQPEATQQGELLRR